MKRSNRVRVMNAFDYNNAYLIPAEKRLARYSRTGRGRVPLLDFKKMVLTPKTLNPRFTGYVATKGNKRAWARTKKLALRKING